MTLAIISYVVTLLGVIIASSIMTLTYQNLEKLYWRYHAEKTFVQFLKLPLVRKTFIYTGIPLVCISISIVLTFIRLVYYTPSPL